jgi:hypothetical protein
MPHLDGNDAERPRSEEAEQPRACPGQRSQWDSCLDAAETWGEVGVKLFPGDARLLLALGSTQEEAATLLASRNAGARHQEHLRQARRFMSEAALANGGLGLGPGRRTSCWRTTACRRSWNRYVLRYEPAGVERAGWHRIEVRLRGQKGVVQTRRGYWVAR